MLQIAIKSGFDRQKDLVKVYDVITRVKQIFDLAIITKKTHKTHEG